MIKSQFNRYVRDALAKRQRKSNIDEANAVIDVFVEAIKEALSENDEILLDRKSTRLNSSHSQQSRMPSSA